MIEQVVVAAVVLAAVGWIVKPLLGSRRALGGPDEDRRTEDLLEAKQSVYRSIVDLEMDHEMGKMGDQDYEQLRGQSKAEALGIIHELEGEDTQQTDLATLEEEIRAARGRLRKN